MKQPLLVVYAPTASGKTELVLQLASRVPIEVISADSRQVYRRLDIGTAKPSTQEQAQLRHHCIDIRNLDEHYSAGVFRAEASAIIAEVYSRGSFPLVVGGSGLYISALCEGLFSEGSLDDSSEESLGIRSELNRKLEVEGRDALYAELVKTDPFSAHKYSDKNPRRVLRALEFFIRHGYPLSEAHRSHQDESAFDVKYFVLERDVQELASRIERRARTMIDQGLVRELENILHDGYDRRLPSVNTVGYKEVLQYLDGKFDVETCVQRIAQNTRRYAKRQRTWGRHQLDASRTIRDSYDNILRTLEKSILDLLITIKRQS